MARVPFQDSVDRSQKVDRSNLESLFCRGKQVSYPDPATTLESLSRIPMTKGMKNTSTFSLTIALFFVLMHVLVKDILLLSLRLSAI